MMVTNAEQLNAFRRPHSGVRRLTARIHIALTDLMGRLDHFHAVRDLLPLATGEHVLTTIPDTHGRAIVATDRALYHQIDPPTAPGTRQWTRLGWEQISTARWDAAEQTLTLNGLVPTMLQVRSGAQLCALAEERARWTTLVVTQVSLDDYGKAQVLVRRRPGTDQLVWVVGVDDNIDTRSPAFQAAVDHALARLHADIC